MRYMKERKKLQKQSKQSVAGSTGVKQNAREWAQGRFNPTTFEGDRPGLASFRMGGPRRLASRQGKRRQQGRIRPGVSVSAPSSINR